MHRQVALTVCAVVTVLTSVRLLTSVHSQVCRQGALVACVEVTVLASVGLLTSVYSQVSRQGVQLMSPIYSCVPVSSTIYGCQNRCGCHAKRPIRHTIPRGQ